MAEPAVPGTGSSGQALCAPRPALYPDLVDVYSPRFADQGRDAHGDGLPDRPHGRDARPHHHAQQAAFAFRPGERADRLPEARYLSGRHPRHHRRAECAFRRIPPAAGRDLGAGLRPPRRYVTGTDCLKSQTR